MMKKLKRSLSLVISITTALVSHADISFFTSFDGAEGYVSAGLDKSIQTGMPHFIVPGISGLYLPSGQAPNFGYVSKNPTASGPRAYYVNGEGADYVAGNRWTTTMGFDFEGLDATNPGSNVHLSAVGFSTSNSASANSMIAAIQKGATQTDQYTFYISGGGYDSVSFNYSDIGDDPADADDLSDKLQINFSLVKSATANEFLATATLTNVDTSTTIATLNTTLSNSAAYNSDLFGFMNAGSITEVDNWDLFKMYDFSYTAVPEPQSYTLMLGGFAALVALRLHRRRY